jgi:hypothetical protein
VWGFKTCVPLANPGFSRRELSFDTPQGARPAVIEPLPARMVEATPSDRQERLDQPPVFVV